MIARPAAFMVGGGAVPDVARRSYLDVDFLMGDGPYLR
jgi:hypothetical protein